MAEMFLPPIGDDDELENFVAAELSKNDDLVDYIQENSLEALKRRFGAAEEDETIRNEGFELAKRGGLVRKPRPENTLEFSEGKINSKDDIKTDSESELSKVFDSARSEHDSDAVSFSDFDEAPISEAEKKADPPPTEPEVTVEEQEPPKKKRGRPRKNPLPDNAAVESPKKRGRPKKKSSEKEQPKPTEELAPKEEKFDTHTRVVFINEELDDGIKRNTDSELESLFKEKNTEGRREFWLRRKK